MKPMRVLQFICPTGLYGAEMWILALARHLHSHKVHCQLAVTRESTNHPLEIVPRFRALNLTAHELAMKGKFDPRVIFSLARLIQKERVDIIHTHGYKSDILGLMAARLARVKAVATPHGFENVKDSRLQTYIRLGNSFLPFFDRVAPLSRELERDMLRMGVPPGKIRMIQNGVDLEEVEAEARPLKTETPRQNTFKICYIGQMAPRKNLGDMLQAFDLLHGEHSHCRLVLIGDGPERESLQARARSLPCGDAVDFLGYRSDRLALLGEMDLFTMSSSLEGIPRCMMEAMAMGIPVAAYDIPGVDQLVLHGKTGLLAPFGHVEQLKDCWKQLLFHRDYAAELSGNAREHILQSFSGARMALEYAALYGEMLRGEA